MAYALLNISADGNAALPMLVCHDARAAGCRVNTVPRLSMAYTEDAIVALPRPAPNGETLVP